MPETRTCPKCGAELPANAPAGICPRCLIQAGLESEQPAGSGSELKPTTLTSGFVPPDPEELAKHFPQLEILELLGKGGMGAVYKARQPGLDRLVAVKILPPEIGADPAFAERFTREARALARLSHQNIVHVYDFGRSDQFFYFIMEYVDGANLRHVIETGSIQPAEALAIVPQICEALQFAHDEGIVHRDIKPENILLDRQSRVKIADFGLAKLLGKAPADATLTGTHQAMGTLHYMAPEQMHGAGSVDHRADIFSLGVVFYEMLTGQLPIGKFEPPSKTVQVDVRLDEVVLRSLESEPDRRYQQVSEFKTDVDSITSDLSNKARLRESSAESQATAPGNAIQTRAWTALEISAMATTVAAFVMATVKGYSELAQRTSPLDGVAVPVTGLAVIASGALLVVHHLRRPAGPRAALPGLLIAVLAVCAGSLPWTELFSPISGWNFRYGAEYSALNLALVLFLIIAGGSERWRGIAMLVAGVAGFSLVMRFNVGPVDIIGVGDFSVTTKPGLPGMFVAAAVSFLVTFAGALQLRNGKAVGVSESPSAEARDVADMSERERDVGGMSELRGPAIGLLVTGILYWATIPLAFYLLMMKEEASTERILWFNFALIPAVAGGILMFGGLQMQRLEFYRTSVVASLLPLGLLLVKIVSLSLGHIAIGPADLVGAPMGLWALIVLSRREVRDAFSTRKPSRQENSNAPEDNPT